MRSCASAKMIGLRYQNSHTNVIEDNGLFRDVAPIVALKAEADPYDLLNRGRLRSAREARMKLGRMDHVAIEVADLDARIERLCGTGGMRLLRRGDEQAHRRSGWRWSATRPA